MAHKSFQDFFAAEYLSLDNNKLDKLTQIYKSKKSNYFNVLDLFYELDYKTFRQTIIILLLTDFLNCFNSRHLDINGVSDELLDQRKILTPFGTPVYLSNSPSSRASTKAMEQEKREGRSGQIGGIHYGTGLTIFFEPDFRRQLITMLTEKKEPFLKSAASRTSKFQNNKILPSEPSKVTDNKDSWENLPENFELINNILKDTNLNPSVFDFESSTQVANQIIQEIEFEKINSSDV
jgi:hypothetical protein